MKLLGPCALPGRMRKVAGDEKGNKKKRKCEKIEKSK
jgi:hypothetical protein